MTFRINSQPGAMRASRRIGRRSSRLFWRISTLRRHSSLWADSITKLSSAARPASWFVIASLDVASNSSRVPQYQAAECLDLCCPVMFMLSSEPVSFFAEPRLCVHQFLPNYFQQVQNAMILFAHVVPHFYNG